MEVVTIGPADDVSVTVEPAVDGVFSMLSPILDIEFAGGPIESATLTIPYDGVGELPMLMFLDEEVGTWVPVDPEGQIDNGTSITATTTHFSRFAVADLGLAVRELAEPAIQEAFRRCSEGTAGGSATYVAEVLADRPVAYWQLAEAGGPFANSAGDGFELTRRDGATPAPSLLPNGPVGATRFTPTATPSDGAVAQSGQGPGTLLPADAFSIEFWLDGVPDGNAAQILEMGDGALTVTQAGDFTTMLTVTGQFAVSGQVSVSVPLSEGGISLDPTPVLDASHIVVTYDGSVLALWVNGVPVTQPAQGGLALAPDDDSLSLASFNDAEIVLDEVAVYDRALGFRSISRHFDIATDAGAGELPDTDGDGLLDCEEPYLLDGRTGRVYQTDPSDTDTDNDELTDYEETGPRRFLSDLYAQLFSPLVLEAIAQQVNPGGDPSVPPSIRIWGSSYYYGIRSHPGDVRDTPLPPGSPDCWIALDCTITYIDGLSLEDRTGWFEEAIVERYGRSVGYVVGDRSWFANIESVLRLATDEGFAEDPAFSLIDSFILQGVQDGLTAHIEGSASAVLNPVPRHSGIRHTPGWGHRHEESELRAHRNRTERLKPPRQARNGLRAP